MKKYKVDEWVMFDPFVGYAAEGNFTQKAVILNICPEDDIYDYEIYIEEKLQFKKVKEEALLSLK